MLWNTDVMRTAGAQLKGPGVAWDSYVYTLPFSGIEVTLSKGERWSTVADHGLGYSTLFRYVESKEQPIKASREQQEKAKHQKAYSQWKERIHAIGTQAIKDAADVGVVYTATVSEDRNDINQEFHCLQLDLQDAHSSWAECWMCFDNEGKLVSGITNTKAFTGLPSLKRILRAYYPTLTLK
jgi:hypothetical protein